jgi:hypothetical protein
MTGRTISESSRLTATAADSRQNAPSLPAAVAAVILRGATLVGFDSANFQQAVTRDPK